MTRRTVRPSRLAGSLYRIVFHTSNVGLWEVLHEGFWCDVIDLTAFSSTLRQDSASEPRGCSILYMASKCCGWGNVLCYTPCQKRCRSDYLSWPAVLDTRHLEVCYRTLQSSHSKAGALTTESKSSGQSKIFPSKLSMGLGRVLFVTP